MSRLDAFASPLINSQMKNDYKLVVLGTNWGFTGTVDAFCAKAKAEGYDGIEMWWPTSKQGQEDERITLGRQHGVGIDLQPPGHTIGIHHAFGSWKQRWKLSHLKRKLGFGKRAA